jgi:hypothetical protein
MALMIPSHPHSTTPPGEVEVFRRLKDDPETENWTVLHSLEISQHVKNICGEADFLILIPQFGVLCLEIKSHKKIIRNHQGWYYGNEQKPDLRGPFKQASEAMHSLRKYLINRSTDYGDLLFWSGACLPYASLNLNTCEWDDWQNIDKAKFRRAPISHLCKGILINAKEKMKSNGHHWIEEAATSYTEEKMKALAQIYRPCFEVIPSSHSKISILESELKNYTEEQFRALDYISANPRVIFSGPAGTGKTFVSIEAALRARRDNPNSRIKWMCFNKNLANWIKAKSSLKESDIEVIHIHRWLLEITGTNPTQAQHNDSEFWESELPQLAIETILEKGIPENQLLDVLIVDEAQDILKSDLLDFLDFMLKGGLSTGQWMLFGDYSMQAIYASNEPFELQTLNGRCSPAAMCSLNINCRNRPRTAFRASTLGRMKPGYASILRDDDQQEPKFRTYTNETDQLECLLETLEELKGHGYKNEDIVILSPLKKRAIALSLNEVNQWKSSLTDKPNPIVGKLRHATIHAFKGLEAPVIVITDIEHVSSRQDEMLLYTGLTRSTDKVYAFIKKSAQQDLITILS